LDFSYASLSLLVQEEIQEEVVEHQEEFFNFGGEELQTFELPDL
jgi:DNA-directed RNA polymerase specialized sigma54-like protein